MQGKYIAFSGIDGCGKTTQSKILAAQLTAKGKDVVLTREPGSHLNGFSVRQLILGHNKIDPVALEMLLQADRAEHTAKVRDLLEAGTWVISDRSYICGLAYGIACGHRAEFVLDLLRLSIRVTPDAAFLIDTTPDLTAKRKEGDELTREEVKGQPFAWKVRDNYLRAMDILPTELHPASWSVVPGGQTIKEVNDEIWHALTTTTGLLPWTATPPELYALGK